MTYTVNCSILLTELPLLERPAAVKAAGFEAVEFWWPFPGPTPAQDEIDAFVGAVEGAGVQLTGLNFFAGDMPAGDRGVLSDPARSPSFRANLDVVTRIGERLGTRAFNALYGRRIEGVTAEEQDALAAENLALAATAVDRIGGTVLLEPVSGAEGYPILTARDALDAIERVDAAGGAGSVKLLADFYHLSVNGDDVSAVIEAHATDFGHIQIADAPGRGEPGTGDLPLADWLERSRELGYTGPIGLEYKATTATPFAWLGEGGSGH